MADNVAGNKILSTENVTHILSTTSGFHPIFHALEGTCVFYITEVYMAMFMLKFTHYHDTENYRLTQTIDQ